MNKLPEHKLNINKRTGNITAGILIFFISLSLSLLFSKTVNAQESQRTITISPPNIEKILNPGQTAEGTMTVINDSDVPLTFDASVRDYVVVDNVGTPNFLPPNTLNKKYSAGAWIEVVPDSFTIQPHQKQQLNYYLQVPSDARPGGHYAGVLYTAATTGSLKTSGASVQTELGTLFYITVNGPINELSMVSAFSTNPFYEYGPVTIATQIKNFGDLHITPAGTITVYDMFGKKMNTLPLQSYNIFPGSARNYTNAFGQKFMFGRFKATLVAAYGREGNLPLMATVYFWVFPWKLAILVVLIIIAIILGLMYWKKGKNTKKQTPKQTPPAAAA